MGTQLYREEIYRSWKSIGLRLSFYVAESWWWDGISCKSEDVLIFMSRSMLPLNVVGSCVDLEIKMAQ